MGNLLKQFQECPKTAMTDRITETEGKYPFVFCTRGIIIKHHLLVMGVLEGMGPMGLKFQEITMLKVLSEISNYILKQHKENNTRSSLVLPVSLHQSTTSLLPTKTYFIHKHLGSSFKMDSLMEISCNKVKDQKIFPKDCSAAANLDKCLQAFPYITFTLQYSFHS